MIGIGTDGSFTTVDGVRFTLRFNAGYLNKHTIYDSAGLAETIYVLISGTDTPALPSTPYGAVCYGVGGMRYGKAGALVKAAVKAIQLKRDRVATARKLIAEYDAAIAAADANSTAG